MADPLIPFTPNAAQHEPPSKRKKWIIISILFFLLITGIVIAAFLLPPNTNNAQPLDFITGLLPFSSNSNTSNPQKETVTTSSQPDNPKSAKPSPGAIPTPSDTSANLLLKLKYSRIPAFSINVESIQRTHQVPNITHSIPQPNNPSSILRLTSAQGEILFEQNFTVTTGFLTEGQDVTGDIIHTLDESVSTFIIPVAQGTTPTTITILSADGLVLNKLDFIYETLQKEVRAPQTIRERLAFAWHRLTHPAANAQNTDLFTIVVINDRGAAASVPKIAAVVEQMRSTIYPWTIYPVEVVQVIRNIPFGCQDRGDGYPGCSDPGFPQSVVASAVPSWDTVIVVTTNTCDCGAVGLDFPSVAAVGANAGIYTITHELGHSVGKMTDEYLYQRNASGPAAENCFNSLQECEDATAIFPTAQCSLGCNNASTFRPATQIMHNTYDPLAFGPLEACLLEEKIAPIFGVSPICRQQQREEEDNGAYWGWRR